MMTSTDGLFKAALETVSDPLLLWGGDGTVAFATRRFQESFGVEPRELEGKSEVGLVELLSRAGARMKEGAQPPLVDAPGGRHFERRVRHLPEGGRLETFRDVTESASAAARREEILGVATHDLRSPLANVRSYASLLLGGGKMPDLDPRVRRAAEVIARNADRALRLVQAFFDSYRAETGEFEVDRQPTPLGSLLEEALAPRRAAAAEKGVELRAPPLDHLPFVAADRERLRYALGAFLDYAIERSSPGKTVEVQSEARGRNVWLGFSDQGVPLTPEQIQESFDRDAQILRERRLGVGFALAVARAVAQAHGGAAGGRPAGERTVFFISLPALEQP
jgi:signal transduction histidine kinase